MPDKTKEIKEPKKGNSTSCLYDETKYGYHENKTITLDELEPIIKSQLEKVHYATGTIGVKLRIFKRLNKLARKLNTPYYTEELRQAFLEDGKYYKNTTVFCKSRYELHRRLIHYIDSYFTTGQVDFTACPLTIQYTNEHEDLQTAYQIFQSNITNLKSNTREGYSRIVSYFLEYLSNDKGYSKLSEIKKGDVSAFFPKVVNEHYHTGLSSVASGLRLFLSIEEFQLPTSFLAEVPTRIAKPQKIINPLSDEELDRVNTTLDSAKEHGISLRDKAVCEIANGTGYRSVDITGITFSNINWDKNILTIIQQKTGKVLTYPLSASMGNAIVDYLLYERPESESEYIFLSQIAPHAPLISHAGIRDIIKKILECAEISRNENIGTRLTRHSRATYLLRRGIPLSHISASLGHCGLNTVNRYLSADEAKLIECILPLP